MNSIIDLNTGILLEHHIFTYVHNGNYICKCSGDQIITFDNIGRHLKEHNHSNYMVALYKEKYLSCHYAECRVCYEPRDVFYKCEVCKSTECCDKCNCMVDKCPFCRGRLSPYYYIKTSFFPMIVTLESRLFEFVKQTKLIQSRPIPDKDMNSLRIKLKMRFEWTDTEIIEYQLIYGLTKWDDCTINNYFHFRNNPIINDFLAVWSDCLTSQ